MSILYKIRWEGRDPDGDRAQRKGLPSVVSAVNRVQALRMLADILDESHFARGLPRKLTITAAKS